MDIFRTVRFGTGEAHGRAEMMEFNYLASQDPIVNAGGRYRVEYPEMPAAIERFAKKLLEFKHYDTMPDALRHALAPARDVPIDVDPILSLDERRSSKWVRR